MSFEQMRDLAYGKDPTYRPGKWPDGFRQDRETGKWHPTFGDDDRQSAMVGKRERDAIAAQRAPLLSPRTPTPKFVPRSDGPMTSASAGGGQRIASGPASIQNFYGNHDPRQTARMAMMEQNREVKRSQARALHSVGRVA